MNAFVIGCRQLVADKRRFAIASVALVFSVALFLGTIGGIGSVSRQIAATSEAFQGLGDVTIAGAGVPGLLNASDQQYVEKLPGVAKTVPFRTLTTSVRLPEGTDLKGEHVTGVPFSQAHKLAGAVYGRMPDDDRDEMLAPSSWAKRSGVGIGSTVTIATQGAPRTFTVVGLIDQAKTSVFLADNLFVPLKAAQTSTTSPQAFTRFDVVLDGVSVAQWRASHGAGLPAHMTVFDPAQATATFLPLVNAVRGILTACAAASVGLALVLVTTAFAAVIRSRQAVLSTMRCVGASTGWIVRMILAQAFLLGLVCSLFGAALGLLLGWGLTTALTAAGQLGVPQFQAEPLHVFLAVAGGVLVSVASALVVALRVLRAPVVGSLRGSLAPVSSRMAWTLGGLGLLSAITAAVMYMRGGASAGVVAFVLVIVAAGLLAAWVLAQCVSHPTFLGWTAWMSASGMRGHWLGSLMTGVFASLVALGIGLALGIVSIGSAMETQISRQFGADVQVQSDSSNDDIVTAIRRVPGVELVSPISRGQIDLSWSGGNKAVPARSIDPATYFQAADLPWTGTDVPQAKAALTRGGVVLPVALAKQAKINVGDSVTVKADAKKNTVPVVGLYASFATGNQIVLDTSTATQLGITAPSSWNIRVTPGSAPEHVQERMEKALAIFPGVTVTTAGKMRQGARQQLIAYSGGAVGLVALVIALATMAIAGLFAQRTSGRVTEFATLRAVGATVSHIRQIVLWDCLLCAGAAIAVAAPAGFAGAFFLRQFLSGVLQSELPGAPFPAVVVIFVGVAAFVTLANVLIGVFAAGKTTKAQIVAGLR
ncbi:ABC transporter permease [Dermatophilus congolensis]|uniref:ABC transporter permease n=1 Tax=Dermatophilus congolensis TaxID=1863 RepID=UPI001AAEA283|nr:ABC transporter permease [Dermatophilus congolensis]MBO3142143.1 FtsX-like permease family protein [Dermatophilus congolensis]MBO3151135.1 FtsX-like permease family protein [Dermatophilus congolensis]MBO3161863.1 FtsX-like permease family protein [Dermatophilus congolensis]MBO3162418.1 FtsX-like permease family protein [Dermatophilus congolensis]MBO3175976.1 FtsX-like permease family protein [Dermatophilus congolensis]